jgi:putative membrane protein (TIGR04086 family)
MNDLDPSAIVRGAVTAAAIALPAVIIQNLVDEHSSLRGLLTLLIAGAFALGGFQAGRVHPARAMTHGGLAALLGAAALALVSILTRTARGASVSPGNLVVALGICLSCGVLGGYLAYRQDTVTPDDADRTAEAGP